jgi:hypothetical protein
MSAVFHWFVGLMSIARSMFSSARSNERRSRQTWLKMEKQVLSLPSRSTARLPSDQASSSAAVDSLRSSCHCRVRIIASIAWAKP